MKKKRLVLISLIGLMFISFGYINLNYLYNPLTFPKGNIAEYGNSFATFKKPVVMEAVRWDTDGNQSFYQYVTDGKVLKNLLRQFAQAAKLEAYDNQRYLSEVPYEERGAEYTILFRQVERWEGDIARGRILISFTFFENNGVFEISGVHFYELRESFKKDILTALSEEEWITE